MIYGENPEIHAYYPWINFMYNAMDKLHGLFSMDVIMESREFFRGGSTTSHGYPWMIHDPMEWSREQA